MKRAAALIRQHLWQPTKPPPDRDGRAWTMARELTIWGGMAAQMEPEALNGAIEHVRAVTGATGPISMRWFLTEPGLLVRSVHEWHKAESLAAVHPGPVRVVIELAPTNEVTP